MRNSGFGALIALGLILVGIAAIIAVPYYKTSPVTVTISGKESVNNDSGHEYRIYTDKGTFVAKDTLIHGRFDTADFYGSLKTNTTYQCKQFGWRIPLFSMFKNLLDCKAVSA